MASLNTDTDGIWTVADGVINLDNGHLDRSQISGSSEMGGFFLMGSWGASTADPIRMNLDNGSTFTNNGTVTFGVDSDSPVGIDVKMTIAGGSTVDLTGGAATAGVPTGLDNNGVGVFGDRDLSFVYGFDSTESNTHVISMSGAGSTLIVDNGIQIATEDFLGIWTLENDVTFEELWNRGILQFEDGNLGAFLDHFSVTGTPDGENYTLTVLGGAIAAVPEPASMLLIVLGSLSMLGSRRRR